jgi:alpha-tubulin suppressor-like RCC1 family protein
VGYFHTCAVAEVAQEALCWGWNSQGMLGDGTLIDRATPVSVISGVAHMSGGTAHTCLVSTSGSVECVGENTFGQLGDGSLERRLTYVPVSILILCVCVGLFGRYYQLFINIYFFRDS